MIRVPEDFAGHTIAREGEAGRRWVEALPQQIEALCERWDLIPDGAPMHGGLSLVVPVRRAGELCVLKIGWVDECTMDEAMALQLWDGRGAVRLLAAEPSLGAMLLERLNPGRSLSDVDIAEAVLVAGRLLRRLAVPAPSSLRSLKRVADQFHESLPARWERCGRPMPLKLLDQARDLAFQLGPSAGSLVVNYDLHYADVLAGDRETWLAVDPKVVAGDLEFGIAQLLWRRLEDMEALGSLDRHFRALAEAAELDPDLARSWTLVRCVDYWLWGLSVGLTYDPERCKVITDWLATAGRSG